MTDVNWTAIHAQLAGKWPHELIRKATKQGNKVYSYLDARDLMAFLDSVVGAGNWSTEAEIVDAANCVVRCTLRIHGVPKTDFGYPNNPVGGANKFAEPIKEAATDAFKRAAVLWGPGREFYTDISNYRWDNEDTQQPVDDGQGRGYSAPVEPEQRADIPKASPYKPASANQLATATKLARLLGRPFEPTGDETSAEISDVITDLSREYNERKGGTPVGQRYSPAQMETMPEAAKQEAARARADIAASAAAIGGGHDSTAVITQGQKTAIIKLAPQAGDIVPENLADWSYLEAAAYITSLQERIDAAKKVTA